MFFSKNISIFYPTTLAARKKKNVLSKWSTNIKKVCAYKYFFLENDFTSILLTYHFL